MSTPSPARRFGALLVLGSAALGACDPSTGPDRGLEVSLTVTPDTVRLGQPAEVAVTVTNLGSEDGTIHVSGCQQLVVTTVAAEVVGPGERVCTADLWVVVLAPGERLVFEDSWAGDGLRGGAGGGTMWLLPGEYRLRGRIHTRSGMVESPGVPVWVVH